MTKIRIFSFCLVCLILATLTSSCNNTEYSASDDPKQEETIVMPSKDDVYMPIEAYLL